VTVSDPIADMLIRIKNALALRREEVIVPSSRVKVALARLLEEAGYISGYEVTSDRPQPMIRLRLKYTEAGEPVLTDLERVSKPGQRVYVGKDELPWVLGGLGIAIVSTPRGVMTAREARRLGVGGEVLCHIW